MEVQSQIEYIEKKTTEAKKVMCTQNIGHIN